jgi:hypothetical protein
MFIDILLNSCYILQCPNKKVEICNVIFSSRKVKGVLHNSNLKCQSKYVVLNELSQTSRKIWRCTETSEWELYKETSVII